MREDFIPGHPTNLTLNKLGLHLSTGPMLNQLRWEYQYIAAYRNSREIQPMEGSALTPIPSHSAPRYEIIVGSFSHLAYHKVVEKKYFSVFNSSFSLVTPKEAKLDPLRPVPFLIAAGHLILSINILSLLKSNVPINTLLKSP